jgi:hypothetical protein
VRKNPYVIGSNPGLLRADIHSQWAKWFIEGLIDPLRHTQKEPSYPHIVEQSFAAVRNAFGDFSQPEQKELAVFLAETVLAY